MIRFFKSPAGIYYAVKIEQELSRPFAERLQWLFGNSGIVDSDKIEGYFIGPKKEMITPWSTNAVEITQNMGNTWYRENRGIHKG